MEIEARIAKLVETLSRFAPGAPLDKFITHIRFPHFKNIAPNTRVDFKFPVTALVGPNGSGKTSVLHALYGAPSRYSVSDLWFETQLDPIPEGKRDSNRFIYGHWLSSVGEVVETRKSRVKKAGKPEYFEPTKATIADGMKVARLGPGIRIKGRSKDRWNPVERRVLYLNFRSELSAFDKYFFFGEMRSTKTLRTRQDRLRAGANRLHEVMLSKDAEAKYWGVRRIFGIRELPAKELQVVSEILGKDYVSAIVVEHGLYGGQKGLSVKFKVREGATYSEAFAGSGEMSVVSLVSQVILADRQSLILLDEPEVSLHPGAQLRLLEFLMDEVKTKHHQVVFTTHSPTMVGCLPPQAIKAFTEGHQGKFDVVNDAHPYVAFNRLGIAAESRVRVLVEDRLAKEVVELALRDLGVDARKLFAIDYLPGGAIAYFRLRIPTFMHEQNPPLLILDGDMAPKEEGYRDPITIPESENSKLDELIRKLVGVSPEFGDDGGDDPALDQKRFQTRRAYLRYLSRHVRFLPRRCPEEIVLVAVGEVVPGTAKEAKEKLVQFLRLKGLGHSAQEIDASAKTLVAIHRENVADDMTRIAAVLKEALGALG